MATDMQASHMVNGITRDGVDTRTKELTGAMADIHMESGFPAVKLGMKWGNYMYEHDQVTYKFYLNLTQEAWEAGALHHIKNAKSVRGAMRWVDFIQGLRKLYGPPLAPVVAKPKPVLDALQQDFLLWKDMTDEPWKYDPEEIAELEDRLMQTSKAWRLRAEYLRRNEAEIRLQGLIQFQALVRGHQARCKAPWTSCAHCLGHCISIWHVGDERTVCEDCYNQVLRA